MVKVLFVCLGNICRSPMAEAVFKKLIEQEGLENKITVDSAGTGDWHIGHAPHKGTQTILTQYQISFAGIKARQVIAADLENFDYVIGMDQENIRNLRKMTGMEKVGHLKRLLDFVPDNKAEDVPDPYFTGNFEEVYELVQAGCKGLLDEIRKEYKF